MLYIHCVSRAEDTKVTLVDQIPALMELTSEWEIQCT